MPRRVSLPGASELFRPTQAPEAPEAPETQEPEPEPAGADGSAGAGRGSGRVRHAEKITVYVSNDELIALEQARLTLRRQGLAVDRGRIVREAIAALLVDLEERGAGSDLVRRLSAPAPDDPAPDDAATAPPA